METPNLPYMPNTLVLPFTYLVDSGAMLANASAQVPLVMAADCAFELLALVASATSDGDTDVIPNGFSVSIQDQSTGRQLSNARIPQRMLTSSTYGYMAYEKYPVRFPPSCTLLFDILDLSGNANRVYIGLKGYKLYGAAQG